jgi:hypothetical protein
MWLSVTARDKIGTAAIIVNVPFRLRSRREPMSLTLLAASLSLLAWIVLLFFTSVTAGAMHLLLALGATLLVRWWALRA